MDLPNGAERRRHARLAIESVPAALLVGGHDLGLHTIVDASEGGVFVRHPAPVVPSGTAVALVLSSPTGRPPMTLNGRIARVVQGGDRPGYGVEWIAPPIDLFDRILALHTARAGLSARTPTHHTPVPDAPGQQHPLARTDEPVVPTGEVLRALVIDHDGTHAKSVARVLGALGLPAAHETRAKSGLELFEAKRRNVVLVLVDFLLPDLSGEELIRRLRKEKPSLVIVATTDVLRTTHAQRPLLHAGANRVLAKPFASEALSDVVRALLPSTP